MSKHLYIKELPVEVMVWDYNRANTITLAADAVVNTTLAGFHGDIMIINPTANKSKKIQMNFETPIVVAGDAIFTVTKDNAATVNVYVETNVIKIQNKTAASVTLQFIATQY